MLVVLNFSWYWVKTKKEKKKVVRSGQPKQTGGSLLKPWSKQDVLFFLKNLAQSTNEL